MHNVTGPVLFPGSLGEAHSQLHFGCKAHSHLSYGESAVRRSQEWNITAQISPTVMEDTLPITVPPQAVVNGNNGNNGLGRSQILRDQDFR